MRCLIKMRNKASHEYNGWILLINSDLLFIYFLGLEK